MLESAASQCKSQPFRSAKCSNPRHSQISVLSPAIFSQRRFYRILPLPLCARARSAPRTRYNGAIDEIVRHGYNGLIVDHDNPEAIADALERLYRDPELWKSLSNNAKRLAAFHSWDEVADRVEEVYEEVLNGRLPIDKSDTVSA
jgi:broad specificity phosphatase PhoE